MKQRLIFFLLFVCTPFFAYASVSVGTINPVNRFTRICQDSTCTTFGTVNWAPTINANTAGAIPVTITDTGVTGYLWGDEIGWVNMSPTSGGVTINPNTGVLSGYAFANTGSWVNFQPTQVSGGPAVGVSINSLGQLSGYAYVSGIKGGWMKFDCSSPVTCVTTDWRPIPARPVNPPSSSGGGGGGGSGMSILPPQPQSTTSPLASTSPESNTSVTPKVTTVISAVNISYDDQNQLVTVAWVTNIPTESEIRYAVLDGGIPGSELIVQGHIGPRTIHALQFPGSPDILYGIRIIADSGAAGGYAESQRYEFKTFAQVRPRLDLNRPVQETAVVITTPPHGGSPASLGGGAKSTDTPEIPLLPQRSSFWALLVSILLLLSRPTGNLMQSARSLRDAQLIVSRIIGVLTLRRRRIVEPWGTIYDSATKRPLDPAYVSLIDESTGKEATGAITDLDGRYGFFVKEGRYHIVASKTHYEFPSVKLLGMTNDPVYDDLYFGGTITIGEHDVIKRNIPLDATAVDWNEEEKKRMGLGSSRTRRQRIVRITNALFYSGFIFSSYVYYENPELLNLVIVVSYITIYVAELLWKRRFHLTQVTYDDKTPLVYGVVKVLFPKSDILVKKVVTDEDGHFYMLVTPGKYVMVIERRNEDGSYTLVHKADVELPKGIFLSDIRIDGPGI